MEASPRTRNADGRNFYQAPCCGVNIGVLEQAVRLECCACGETLWQGADVLAVWEVNSEDAALA